MSATPTLTPALTSTVENRFIAITPSVLAANQRHPSLRRRTPGEKGAADAGRFFLMFHWGPSTGDCKRQLRLRANNRILDAAGYFDRPDDGTRYSLADIRNPLPPQTGAAPTEPLPSAPRGRAQDMSADVGSSEAEAARNARLHALCSRPMRFIAAFPLSSGG